MKPPPRARNKPARNRDPSPEAPQDRRACRWSRKEQKMLLDALRRQSWSRAGSPGSVDYSLLHKEVPSRSVCEIQLVVERLQNKVISVALSQLRTGKRSATPIQTWTRLARAASGGFDAPLSKALSQMWAVASAEPHTLRNRQPAAGGDGAVGRSAPAKMSLKGPAPPSPLERPVLSQDSTVDFERIYNYLSDLHKPEDECELTAMESAVLLDLLMSLPEELSSLPSQSLRRHLIQAHRDLSRAEGSARAGKALAELEGRRRAGGREPGSESADPPWTGLCPPLNPFAIPPELLKRR